MRDWKAVRKAKRARRRARGERIGRSCVIYALYDENNRGNGFRYVGQTKLRKPENRVRSHFRDIKRKQAKGEGLTRSQEWMREVGQSSIGFAVLEFNGQMDISEAVWIDRLRRSGSKLLNIASVCK
jgi:hypothetical protein